MCKLIDIEKENMSVWNNISLRSKNSITNAFFIDIKSDKIISSKHIIYDKNYEKIELIKSVICIECNEIILTEEELAAIIVLWKFSDIENVIKAFEELGFTIKEVK